MGKPYIHNRDGAFIIGVPGEADEIKIAHSADLLLINAPYGQIALGIEALPLLRKALSKINRARLATQAAE